MAHEAINQHRPLWLVHLEAAAAAHGGGDIQGARAHMDAALEQDTGRALRLRMLHADILLAEKKVLAAQEELKAAAEAYPAHFWPHFRLALLAREQGDKSAAAEHLEQALARDPDGKQPRLLLLQADLHLEAGQGPEAIAVLQPLARVHPDLPGLPQRLLVLARTQRNFDVARAIFDTVLKNGIGSQQARFVYVQMVSEAGDIATAATQLEELRAQNPENPLVLGRLARVYQASGQADREQQALLELIAADPLDPVLLRHLFAGSITAASPDQIDHICSLLQTRLDTPLAQELEVQTLIQTQRFAAALKLQRKVGTAQRTPLIVAKIANALVGLYRPAQALRYLGYSLRRWPDNTTLLALYMRLALRTGRYSDIERQLGMVSATAPDHVVLGHWFTLHAYRGDLDAAASAYVRLRDMGRVQPLHTSAFNTLIFTSVDPAAAQDMFDRIGHPLANVTVPHFRSGLFGQQLTEFILECEALAKGERFETLEDWARARPNSTVAAVRLINAWRSRDHSDVEVAPKTEIPRQIFQYWDDVNVPDDIQTMTASWASVPGFTHRLMDRTSAVHFLRDNMGPRWVTAFRMAHGATQQADFLRLCVLMKFGGIYADSDDVLVGDLSRVLGSGQGLITYVEPMGGIVANNFIAAPPMHPVISYAARLARAALLQRSNETVWSSTGPGLLTRALAQYILRADTAKDRQKVTILGWSDIAEQILMHNPAHHKMSAKYWNRPGGQSEPKLWDKLQHALEA